MTPCKLSRIRLGVWMCILILSGQTLFAENLDPDNTGNHYSWSENTGWINLKSSDSIQWGVTVSDDALTGYGWSENTGWINFSSSLGGVINDGAGNLSGYAWTENSGWISFSCSNTGSCGTNPFGVVINPATGEFSGFAWAENLGWINFSPGGVPVKTSWPSPQPTGSLKMTVSPQAAVDAGAVWKVDSGTWNNSGVTLQGVISGMHTVSFKPIPKWIKPDDQLVIIVEDNTTNAGATYYHFCDFDKDGDVDIEDLMKVGSCWNTKAGHTGFDAAFDLDGDGDIDIADLMIVVAEWTG